MDKQKALDAALSQIDKQIGKNKIFRLGDRKKMNVEVISTGSFALDYALGIGGIPRGRITEIYGGESSGKTTIAYHLIAECQKNGGICAFIDAEQSVDPVYAEKLGVVIDDLYVSQPDTGEEALEIMDSLIRSGAIDLIILDSVAALVPKDEIAGVMGQSHIGLQARLMSQALRKIGSSLNNTNTAAVFINQLRDKVGQAAPSFFGTPEITPGGRALKFWASVRLEVKKGEPVKNGTEQIGSRTKVKVAKNKCAAPFKRAEFDLIFGEGISKTGELIDFATEQGIIKKSGAWFSYNDEKIGQGRENVKAYLEANKEIFDEIYNLVRAKLFSNEDSIPIEDDGNPNINKVDENNEDRTPEE